MRRRAALLPGQVSHCGVQGASKGSTMTNRILPLLAMLMMPLPLPLPFATAMPQPPPASVTSESPTPAPDTIGSETEERQRPPRTPRPLEPLPEELSELIRNATELNPEKTVLLAKSRKSVLLRTQVACNECLLEMLCYNEDAEKGHESLLWVRAQPKTIHMALLATGAKPGTPATFSPEFKAPTGPVIDIYLNWVDTNGKLQRKKAQTWMRHNVSRYYSAKLEKPPAGVEFPHLELRYDPYNKEILWYGQMTDEQRKELLKLDDSKIYQAAINKFHNESQPKPMNAEFVFTGSYHYTIEDTGQKIYAADSGYVICVANFAGALIDVKEASSADDGGQAYEAWPGRVPPQNTPVIVELVPQLPMANADKATQPTVSEADQNDLGTTPKSTP